MSGSASVLGNWPLKSRDVDGTDSETPICNSTDNHILPSEAYCSSRTTSWYTVVDSPSGSQPPHCSSFSVVLVLNRSGLPFVHLLVNHARATARTRPYKVRHTRSLTTARQKSLSRMRSSSRGRRRRGNRVGDDRSDVALGRRRDDAAPIRNVHVLGSQGAKLDKCVSFFFLLYVELCITYFACDAI